MIALSLKDDILKGSREMHYFGLGHSKLKALHPVNYFSGFLGKNVNNGKQQNRTLSCSYICIYQVEWVNLRGHLDLFHSAWCLLFVCLLQGRSQTFQNEGAASEAQG